VFGRIGDEGFFVVGVSCGLVWGEELWEYYMNVIEVKKGEILLFVFYQK
jgi:hypothetical protein